MRRAIIMQVISILCFVLGNNVFASTIIDTTPSWDGTYIGWWGVHSGGQDSLTHGQTFTVGSDNRLDSFTFYVNDGENPVTFGAYVMEWSSNKAVGSVLFAKGPIDTTNNHGLDGWEAITVDTGGLELVSGKEYVAFWCVSEFMHLPDAYAWFGYTHDAYSGGEFVYNVHGLGQLTATDWITDYPEVNGDLAFKMSFNVPEPATLLLLGLGAMIVRRKRS